MPEFLALIEWLHWLLFFVAATTGGAIVGAMFTHWTHRTERKREP
jgi:hypothetical protein